MKTSEVLHHYCSSETFLKIVQDRQIWLSSLSLSNDTLEGKLVARVMTRLAQADGLDQQQQERLLQMVSVYEKVFSGCGFCLSEEPDLLSQWRGYAANASGVSIGFSKSYLEWLSKKLYEDGERSFWVAQVAYLDGEHDEHVRAHYLEAKEHVDEIDSNPQYGLEAALLQVKAEQNEDLKISMQWLGRPKLREALKPLMRKLYELKTEAFKEEREWRLLSILVRDDPSHCGFHHANDKIVPHIPFELPKSREQPIVKVILGPKHRSPIDVVKRLLSQYGFVAEVERSQASYC